MRDCDSELLDTIVTSSTIFVSSAVSTILGLLITTRVDNFVNRPIAPNSKHAANGVGDSRFDRAQHKAHLFLCDGSR